LVNSNYPDLDQRGRIITDPRIRIHNSDSNRIQVSYNIIDVKKHVIVVVNRQAGISLGQAFIPIIGRQ
jgi:hypothetical protein